MDGAQEILLEAVRDLEPGINLPAGAKVNTRL
jgi:hypothetical protein